MYYLLPATHHCILLIFFIVICITDLFLLLQCSWINWSVNSHVSQKHTESTLTSFENENWYMYIVLRCEAMPVCTVWRSKATQKAWGTSQEWRLHLIPSKTPGMLFSLTATGDLSSATGGLGKKCSDISLYSSSLNRLLHISSHFQTNGLHRWRLDFSTVRGWKVLREISRH